MVFYNYLHVAVAVTLVPLSKHFRPVSFIIISFIVITIHKRRNKGGV